MKKKSFNKETAEKLFIAYSHQQTSKQYVHVLFPEFFGWLNFLVR